MKYWEFFVVNFWYSNSSVGHMITGCGNSLLVSRSPTIRLLLLEAIVNLTKIGTVSTIMLLVLFAVWAKRLISIRRRAGVREVVIRALCAFGFAAAELAGVIERLACVAEHWPSMKRPDPYAKALNDDKFRQNLALKNNFDGVRGDTV